uniref:G-patch domain-containing protein n=1 Tax=Ditylenchus dipsaci TaxID=166011 RepID=A0A915D2D6_9BILA
MFSYSPFHSNVFTKQPDLEKSVNVESRFVDLADFFFVSHPRSGQKEGKEHERIMFFYPDSENLNKQTDVTGFAEAVVNFTSTLSEPNCFSLHHEEYNFRYINSANSREIVLIVEGGEFLIGTCLNRKICKEQEYFPHLATIKALLEKSYESFRLFFGTFSALLASNRNTFKQRLNCFFTPYLQQLHVNKIPLMDLFSGVECLATRCMEEFPEIKQTMFFYQNKLIQYSVNKSDLIAINQFLTDNLIPFADHSELIPELGSNRGSKYTGSFITGVTDFLGDLSQETQFPIVYLSSDTCSETNFNVSTEYTPFELVAYRTLNATICCFVHSECVKKTGFLEGLAEFLDKRMSELASKIGEAVKDLPGAVQSDIAFHFIYYNPDSLSLRTNFSSAIALSQSPSSLPPASIYKLACETYDHFTSNDLSNDFAQVFVKAENDWWIVFKKMNRRIITLFIPHTVTSNVSDIHDQTNLILSHFSNNMFISSLPTMSDSDDDYMSADFMSRMEDVKPGVNSSRSQKRMLQIDFNRDAANQRNVKMPKKHELEKMRLDEGLNRPICSESKGFSLLSKMGYKPGMSLGKKREGESEGIKEPVEIQIKINKSGLGHDSDEKKNKKRDAICTLRKCPKGPVKWK